MKGDTFRVGDKVAHRGRKGVVTAFNPACDRDSMVRICIPWKHGPGTMGKWYSVANVKLLEANQ